jgi:hypothetical protein
MTDARLVERAEKYNIPHSTMSVSGVNVRVADQAALANRSEVISALRARDTSLRAGYAIVISIIALFVSLGELVTSFFKK